MKRWVSWLWWRLAASLILFTLSYALFILGFDYLFFGPWRASVICFLAGIVVWFYRGPDLYNPEKEGRMMPMTEHEARLNWERSKQDELDRIRLSGYWVDRRWYGRFRGPND